MNNKGFTLVELLVTLALIAIMATLIVVNTTGLSAGSEDTEEIRFERDVRNAGCYYVDSLNMLSIREQCFDNTMNCQISLGSLIEKGWLDQDMVDPKTSKKISEEPNDIYVDIKWNNDLQQPSFRTKDCKFVRGEVSQDITNFEKYVTKLVVNPNGGAITLNGQTYTSKKTISQFYNTSINYGIGTKPGYAFKYWTKSGDCGTLSNMNGEGKYTFPQSMGKTCTLTANWDVTTFNITYNLDGGTATNPSTYTINDNITLNNPTKPGYWFNGWTGTDLEYPTKDVVLNRAKGDRVYTATYEPIPKIIITSSQLDSNNVTNSTNLTFNIRPSFYTGNYRIDTVDYYNLSDKSSGDWVNSGTAYTLNRKYTSQGRHMLLVHYIDDNGGETYGSLFFTIGTTNSGGSAAMNISQTVEITDDGIYSNGNPLATVAGYTINVPTISGHSSGNSDTFDVWGWDGTKWVAIVHFNSTHGYCHTDLNEGATTGTWKSDGNTTSGSYSFAQNKYYKLRFKYYNAHPSCVSKATNSLTYSIKYRFIGSEETNEDLAKYFQ